jgi:hypothetical protein
MSNNFQSLFTGKVDENADTYAGATDFGGSGIFNTLEIFFRKATNNWLGPGWPFTLFHEASGAVERFIFEHINSTPAFTIKYVEDDGTLRARTWTPTSPALSVKTWYHYIQRFEPSNGKFYLYVGEPDQAFPDDYESTSYARNSASVSGFASFQTSDTDKFFIGKDNTSDGNWRGQICEFRIWENYREDAELNHYNFRFLPESPTPEGGRHYLKLNEGTGSGSPTDFWGSMALDYTDGADGDLGVAQHPFESLDGFRSVACRGPSNGTYASKSDEELDIHPSGFKTLEMFFTWHGDFQRLYAFGPSGSADGYFYYRHVSSLNVEIRYTEDDGTIRTVNRQPIVNDVGYGLGEVDTTRWDHFINIFDSSDNKFYTYWGRPFIPLDEYWSLGLARNSSSVSGFQALTGTVDQTFGRATIGKRLSTTSNIWKGDIAELRIWEDQRTDNELEVYSSGFVDVDPVPQGGLHYFRLNEPSGFSDTKDLWGLMSLPYTFGSKGNIATKDFHPFFIEPGDPPPPSQSGGNSLFLLI